MHKKANFMRKTLPLRVSKRRQDMHLCMNIGSFVSGQLPAQGVDLVAPERPGRVRRPAQRLRAAVERDVRRQGGRAPEQAARERGHGAQDVRIRGRIAEGGARQPQDAPRVRAAADEMIKAEVRCLLYTSPSPRDS